MSQDPGSPISAWSASSAWSRQGALNSASSAGTAGIGGRAVSGGVAAEKQKPGRLMGPFTERSLQSAKQSSNSKKLLQPPISHGTKPKVRSTAPPTATLQQTGREADTPISAAAARKQQRAGTDCRSHRSTSRPAMQAAAAVGAAEAAVSAAAAVLKRSDKQLHQEASESHCNQDVQSQQQSQGVSKVSPRGRFNTALDCSIAAADANVRGFLQQNPQLAAAHHHQSEDMPLGALQVLGVTTRRPPEHQPTGPATGACSRLLAGQAEAYAPAAASADGGRLGQAVHQQMYHLPDYADIDTAQQSPAVIAAAQALVKRLRIQQRSRHGPPAFQRATLPRPASPSPKVLNGALLMSSCPDALVPSDITSADLSSADITSIHTPDPTDLSQSSAVQALQDSPAWTDFTRLRVLDLSDNRLSSIAGLAWMPALVQLAVSANRLRSLQSLSAAMGHSHLSDAAAAGNADGPRSCTVSCESHGSSASVSGPDGQYSNGQLHNSSDADVAWEVDGTPELQTVQHTAQLALDSPQGSSGQFMAGSSLVHLEAAAADPLPQGSGVAQQPATAVCSDGFNQLELLDVSYNMVSADELLGLAAPVARLPRLQQLLAAGSGISVLPAQLGPFSSLTYLDLSHNKLTSTALAPLWQLPALSQLLLSHNPIHAIPDMAIGQHVHSSSHKATAIAPQLSLLDLSYSRVADAEQLLPLLQLPRLGVLMVIGTLLAQQCQAGIIALQREDLTIITHQQEPTAVWQHSSKQKHSQRRRQRQQQGATSTGRLPTITVDEDIIPGQVLAAAGRNAILGLQPEQLVAAFERVGEGIDKWKLAPVEEESSTAWQLAAEEDETADLQQQQQRGKKTAESEETDEAIVDQTFLTGVGIVGELPDDEEDDGVAAAAEADEFQDPTERVALALGMEIAQLAHYTHKNPRNTSGAVQKLRHALAHPLVDPEAGERPQQHHAAMTATAAAKQRPRQLLPLPQPIPAALDTRVVAVQGIDNMLQDMRGRLQLLEGSLLQQLQAQADKLSAAAQQMAASAAAEAAATQEQ